MSSEAAPCLYFPDALPLPSRVECEDLAGLPGNIPAARLSEYLGKSPADTAKKRRRAFFCLKTGKNWKNTQRAKEKFAKIYATARYIYTAKKRGWMGEPETDDSLFAHATTAVFKKEGGYSSPRLVRELRTRVFALVELLFLGKKPTPPQVYNRKATPSVKEGENKTHSDAPTHAPTANASKTDRLHPSATPPLSESAAGAAQADGQKEVSGQPATVRAPATFVGLVKANAARFEAAHRTGDAARVRFSLGLVTKWASVALAAGKDLAALVGAYERCVKAHGERAKAAGAVSWAPSGMAGHLVREFAAAPTLTLERRFELRRLAAERKARRATFAAMGRAADLAAAARKATEAAERRAALDADALRRGAAADTAGKTHTAADLFSGFNFAALAA